MPTDRPPRSLAEPTQENLLQYLDSCLSQGERFLYGTSLEWAIQPMFHLLGHQSSPARYHYSRSPASSSFTRHHCFMGGLMYHSVEVFYLATKMWASIAQTQFNREDRAALWLASILHDMNKCCDPLGRPYYTENTLQNGKVSDKKPWRSNEQFLKLDPSHVTEDNVSMTDPNLPIPVGAFKILQIANRILNTESGRIGDGKFSYLLACAFSPELERLPAHIVQAIHFHDGGYGQARYELSGNEHRLTILLHAADMMSSRFEGEWLIDPIDLLHERIPSVEPPTTADGTPNPQGPPA